ncbi:hypothetical protein [Amycolatopsis alkalitolerans]|nr:hypothetical protein [Amycolatopsis alkalitolerans]
MRTGQGPRAIRPRRSSTQRQYHFYAALLVAGLIGGLLLIWLLAAR